MRKQTIFSKIDEKIQIVCYTIGMYIFTMGAIIATFFVKKIRHQVKGHAGTWIKLHKYIKKDDKVVWFHAASLGEFEQGRLLMERVRRELPEYKILLTFFSPSGYEVRKDYEGADIVCYLPFDTPANAASFLRMTHPEIAIFIKYEFWYHYLHRAHKRGVKVYSVSSIFREDQHFFKWYGMTQPLYQFDYFFVQNQESKDLLARLGIDNVTIVGDTRFDRVIKIKQRSANLPIVKTFVDDKPTFIAGSSWQPDEQIYIPYFANHRDWKLIIAPHKITGHRLNELRNWLADRHVIFYSDIATEDGQQAVDDSVLRNAEVLIVDCFGKLSSIYRYGNLALVGGGFGVGIHNVPEAAVYGIPVLFGPNNKKFQEAQALLQCKGSFEFTDAASFANLVDNFIQHPETMTAAGQAASQYIYGNAGAVDKCYNAIFHTSTNPS
jgi:3-deoxy-D-manno-octulosonic-acid transferase